MKDQRMGTFKKGIALGALSLGITGLLGTPGFAQARVTTDAPAAILVFPRVVVDPSGLLVGQPTETVVQITNGDRSSDHVLQCFYIDATRRCSNGASSISEDGACWTSENCVSPGTCQPAECSGIDFTLTLSPGQPVGWSVFEGRRNGVCSSTSNEPGSPCDVDSDCDSGTCLALPGTGVIPPIGGPWEGELKCIVVENADSVLPVNANVLVGNARIYEDGLLSVHNAIGIQSVLSDGTVQGDTNLQLGGTGAEYAGCPTSLLVNHPFDNQFQGFETELTFVSCTETPEGGFDPVNTPLQFIVVNEFEQRFSTSSSVRCANTVQLSNIDRRVGSELTSIFNYNVQGTLVGQTFVRPALTADGISAGNGVLGVAITRGGVEGQVVANNMFMRGQKAQADFVRYPAPSIP